jgi:hypothetical protein
LRQKRAPDRIIPVVVVRQTAQTGLNPADDQRYVLEGLAQAVAVDCGGAVWAQARLAARREVVSPPALETRAVVSDE